LNKKFQYKIRDGWNCFSLFRPVVDHKLEWLRLPEFFDVKTSKAHRLMDEYFWKAIKVIAPLPSAKKTGRTVVCAA